MHEGAGLRGLPSSRPTCAETLLHVKAEMFRPSGSSDLQRTNNSRRKERRRQFEHIIGSTKQLEQQQQEQQQQQQQQQQIVLVMDQRLDHGVLDRTENGTAGRVGCCNGGPAVKAVMKNAIFFMYRTRDQRAVASRLRKTASSRIRLSRILHSRRDGDRGACRASPGSQPLSIP